MELKPQYSYEFNRILNTEFNENDQIKNFASLITDKDRFLNLLPVISQNKELIEKYLGLKLKEEYEFYIVRGEKFKSFSMPITIEYSILPEEMILFLLKEIIKNSIEIRFPDELIREQYINSFIDFISIQEDLENINLVKFGKNLHEESQKQYPNYEFKDIDFKKKTLKEYVEEMYK